MSQLLSGRAFYGPPFLALVLTLAVAVPSLAAVSISGTINSDTTWTVTPDPIVFVTNTLTISPGVTLTINPGVTVKIERFDNINVNGTLNAIGNAGFGPDSLIYFTSIRDDNLPPGGGDDTNGDGNATTPANSNWGQILFSSTGAGTLENCELWFGGYSNEGIIVCDGSSPTLESTTINAGYYGVQCINGATPTLSNTDVSACTSVPIAISVDSNPTFSSITFSSSSDNGFDAIGILATTLTGANTIPVRSTTLAGQPIDNITYMLLGDITVSDGATLTVAAGVVIKALNASTDIHVDGTLNAIGTSDPDSAIVFTSFKDDNVGDPADTNNDGSTTSPSSNDWGGIDIRSGGAATIDYCTIRYCGFGTKNSAVRMEDVGAGVTISNSEISDASYGIEIVGNSSPTITDNTISNCTNTPILMSVTATPTFSGNTFVGNGVTALGLLNGTIDVDATIFKRDVGGFVNITYVLIGNLTMGPGTVLTVNPGVVLKMKVTGTVLTINGGLLAQGAPADSIVFTSWKDDGHGNPADTNGDGGATLPAQGQWGRIEFSATSVDSLSQLDYCFIGYGGVRPGQSWNGTVRCMGVSPTITNCHFASDRIGVAIEGASSATITGNHFFNSSSVPIHMSALSTPVINNNTYDQNEFHALGLIAETLSSSTTIAVPTAGVAQFGIPFTYYLVQGTVTVASGSILTIDPDVILKHNSYGFTVNGGILAEDLGGSNPILFTDIKDDSHGGDSNVNGNATNPVVSDWPSLKILAPADDANCRLDGCEFWYGGSGSQGVVHIERASPTVTNCSFEFNDRGIWAEGPAPDTEPVLTNNLIRQCRATPIIIDILSNPTFGGNAFDSNGIMALGYIGGSLGQDGTIPTRTIAGYTNITNVLNSALTVQLGVTLTINPGVVLKGWDGASPFYAARIQLTISGRLVMDGDPGNEIILTSIEDDTVGNPLDTNNDGALSSPAPDDWHYVSFLEVSDDTSIIEHTIMRYGGTSFGSVRMQTASPTIRNVVFEDSEFEGVRMEGTSAPVIQDCTFTRCTRTPVTLSLLSNPIFSGNTLNDNFYSAIGVLGETMASDVTWTRRAFAGDDRREYVLLTSLTVGTGANLTIEPGVTIKPLSGVDIVVRRGLFANGGADPESLIVFTSARDDFWGGDTNGDSTDTNGSSYRWGTIEIEPTALNANVQFSNCVFMYGSTSSAEGAVTVQGSLSPSFTDCIFAHGTNGINYTQASGNPANGTVDNCDFFDHSGFAIENTGLAHVISAENCWWGDDTGPTHSSNPGGLGDTVTDMVDFVPWQGMGLGNYHLGDVSLNGELHAFDAALVFRWLVPDTTLTALQQVIGDVTCNGSPTAFDATLVLQYVADLIVTFPCLEIMPPGGPQDVSGEPGERGGVGLASGGRTAAAGMRAGGGQIIPEDGEYKVTLPDFEIEPGTTVEIPLLFEGVGEAYACQFLIRPGTESLRIVGIQPGEVSQGAQFYSGIRPDGTARIAMGSVTELGRGTIAILEVEVDASFTSDAALVLDFTEALINEQDVLANAESADGHITTSVDLRLPDEFGLAQNAPNPFRPNTSIVFRIPTSVGAATDVEFAIFGVDGRRIRTLASGAHTPGEYELRWDGRDAAGERVASGVYFYRLEAGSFRAQKKMVLLK